MNRWIGASLLAISQVVMAQSAPPQRQPTEQDCVGLMVVLPTFQIPEMKKYYENNREAGGKELTNQIRSLAEAGDKTAQFTYSNMLLTGTVSHRTYVLHGSIASSLVAARSTGTRRIPFLRT